MEIFTNNTPPLQIYPFERNLTTMPENLIAKFYFYSARFQPKSTNPSFICAGGLLSKPPRVVVPQEAPPPFHDFFPSLRKEISFPPNKMLCERGGSNPPSNPILLDSQPQPLWVCESQPKFPLIKIKWHHFLDPDLAPPQQQPTTYTKPAASIIK